MKNILFIFIADSRRIANISGQAGKVGEPWAPLKGFLGYEGLCQGCRLQF